MKLLLEQQIYNLEATQKAAYRFIDLLTILIQKNGEQLLCEVEPVSGHEDKFDEAVANFKRELLDQQLRKQIRTETEATRNLILAYAFSRSGLQG